VDGIRYVRQIAIIFNPNYSNIFRDGGDYHLLYVDNCLESKFEEFRFDINMFLIQDV